MNAGAERAVALIVIAKQPLPGRCKTRLCPPLDHEQAALLAEASLADTLTTVAAARARRHVLALDGLAGGWVPRELEVIAQAPGGLDSRLAAAFEAVGGPALLVGMDTPQLRPEAIEAAARELMRDGVDAVLGPTADGGYWAIGLRRPRRAVFAGVPMSAADTARAQRCRLAQLGMRCAELEPMRDFDTVEDARVVARLCPGTRFARAFESLPCAIAA